MASTAAPLALHFWYWKASAASHWPADGTAVYSGYAKVLTGPSMAERTGILAPGYLCRLRQPPPGSIRFEYVRASGPGGQHVNKTDSAVRATHVQSGLSVKVQSERSQHANKRLAMALIEQKLAQYAEDAQAAQRLDRRLFHHDIERGNPVRTFRGMRFTEK